jgi:hypothetical protein
VFTGRGTLATKVYCIDYTGGAATNVQVTVDPAGADSLYTQVGATTSRTALDTFGCSAASDILVTADRLASIERGVDAAFYLAVIA